MTRRNLASFLLGALLTFFGVPAATAQTESPPSGPAAWWARVNDADQASTCSAERAWKHAIDVEGQAEFDLDGEPLADALDGAELVSEQQVVSALQARGQGIDRVGFRA